MNDQIKVQDLDKSTQDLLNNLFKDWKFARFGVDGTILPVSYKQEADDYRHMAVRPDDVWVVTFPRSGTTWTQELVWLLANDLDYEAASKTFLKNRYVFPEIKHVRQKSDDPEVMKLLGPTLPSLEDFANKPSPRFFRTHLPFSLLPRQVLDTAKVVYVARDPRDVVVSYYHFSKHFLNYKGDFRTFWKLFVDGLVPYSPFFPHVEEAWALRRRENMLFLFYEHMLKDLPSCIQRVADFFGKEISDEEIKKLCDHLHIDNFRHNQAVNYSVITDKLGDPKALIRNGKSGEWRSEFGEETAAQAQRWLQEHLADTDLRFPTHY